MCPLTRPPPPSPLSTLGPAAGGDGGCIPQGQPWSSDPAGGLRRGHWPVGPVSEFSAHALVSQRHLSPATSPCALADFHCSLLPADLSLAFCYADLSAPIPFGVVRPSPGTTLCCAFAASDLNNQMWLNKERQGLTDSTRLAKGTKTDATSHNRAARLCADIASCSRYSLPFMRWIDYLQTGHHSVDCRLTAAAVPRRCGQEGGR